MIKYVLNVGRKEISLKGNGSILDIDKYTSNFSNDEQLKIDLYNQGQIDIKDNYGVNISYFYKERKTLPVLYKKHLSLINPNDLNYTYVMIYKYIKSHINDRDFIEKLIFCYSSILLNSNVLVELNSIRNGSYVTQSKASEIVDEFCSLTMKLAKSNNFNYGMMRRLGIIIYKFDELKKRKGDAELSQDSQLSYHFSEVQEYRGEQLSLFKKN